MTAGERTGTETIPDPVRQGARRWPEAPALEGAEGEVLSYSALDGVVEQAARRLDACNIAPEEHVACLMPRTPRYVVLLLALWRRGMVAAPLPARTPPAGRARLLEAVAARTLIAKDAAVEAPSQITLLPASEVVGDLEQINPPAEKKAPLSWPAARPMTLVFTSGSTGGAKAALHTAGNHFFNADGARDNLALEPGDRWLLSLPVYHVGGLAIVLRCLWSGATVAFPAEGETLAAAVRRSKATHLSLVAAQLRRLFEATSGDVGSLPLKAVLLGGGPVPPALIEEAYHAGLPVALSYGLTEMASQVTTTAPGDPLGVLLRTAGRPLPHRRVHIRAASGDDPGEILVGGATRFAGYMENGRLREPFVDVAGEAGWFATGDLGRLDAAGRLRVVGRRDRRFISGGENIQPEEIETALRRLPDVADAVVVPVPHETFGQRPVAFIRGQRREPFHPRHQSPHLREALRKTLPKYKVPDAFYVWPEGGEEEMKPDRAFLRQKAQALMEERAGGSEE